MQKKVLLSFSCISFLLIFMITLPVELTARETALRPSVFSEYRDTLGMADRIVESLEVDLNGDGQYEVVEIYKASGTSSLLRYQVWRYEIDRWYVWHENKGLYQGVVLVQDGKFLERLPIYRQGDVNGLPRTYVERVYIFIDQGPQLQDECEKTRSILPFDTGEWVNPPREEIEEMLRTIALEKGVPPEIAKAVAFAESDLRQFHNGEPLLSFDNLSWGIMQVTPSEKHDMEKLKYDIEYNITAVVEILWEKWTYNLPTIGENDPRILENWYFAIWAYNGWSQRNNPNMMPYEHDGWTQYEAYQDKVLRFAQEQFGQDITPIPPEQLPEEGLPESTEVFPTPEPSHWAEYRSYEQGDSLIAIANLALRSDDWQRIGTVPMGTKMDVLDGPVLHNKHIRYKVKTLV